MKLPDIHAAQTTIPRQYATFPEWRSAMLAALSKYPSLSGWRGRGKDDLGLMLLEMWAYVCDVVSFYDEVIAHETYLRTARLRPSLRKLVGILGYVPRPAIAAQVSLALLADGKNPVDVPAGTAFRSGAFGSNPPQVFELDKAMTIYPGLNRMAVKHVYPALMPARAYSSVLLEEKGLKVRQGDPVLFVSPSLTAVRKATAVSPYTGTDGITCRNVELSAPLALNTSAPVPEVRFLVPTATGSLWRFDAVGGDYSPLRVVAGATEIHLDGQYPQIRANDHILLAKNDDIRWFRVTGIAGTLRTLMAGLTSRLYNENGDPAGSVTSPNITVPVTRLTLDAAVNDRKSRTGLADWSSADARNLTLYYGLVPAGRIRVEAKMSLTKSDPIVVGTPRLDAGVLPHTFLVEDTRGKGVLTHGNLDSAEGALEMDQSTEWGDHPLDGPLQILGNVAVATRGETVRGEVLGRGDAGRETLRFKLKKKPLTYLPFADGANESGIKNTLTVHVNGVLWNEVPTFFGAAADAQVYMVRQNDEGESEVIFGGGSRPATGALITADYRHGAGAAAPPWGSIHQLARPVPGLKGIRNPVGAYGGDDSEAPDRLSHDAPRSALLLGRVISMQDMEAAAATVGGVKAVSAQWRWNREHQQPVAEITYIGESVLKETISQKLHSLCDPTTPISVTQAIPLPSNLFLHVEIDEGMTVGSVMSDIFTALMDSETGLLCRERVGIGKPLFRSRIFEKVLSVPGVVAVHELSCNNGPFLRSSISPPAGRYFDFEQGVVNVNGVSYE